MHHRMLFLLSVHNSNLKVRLHGAAPNTKSVSPVKVSYFPTIVLITLLVNQPSAKKCSRNKI